MRITASGRLQELRPTLDEGEILLGKIEELWHDEWTGYLPLDYDSEQTVVHSGAFVSEDGVHVNQVERLWSLIEPWLEKFRGLSTPGSKQSVRTDGLIRSLNLAGAPLHDLIDCFVLDVLHQVR